jgi:hypothetical protein
MNPDQTQPAQEQAKEHNPDGLTPEQGQTGDDAEFAEEVFPVEFDGPGGAGKVTEYRVDADYARKLLAQRDSARKERDALKASENDRLAAIEDLTANIRPDEDSPDCAGTVVERVQSLLASHAQIDAQLAGMRELIQAAPHTLMCASKKYLGGPINSLCDCWKSKAGTSGQALLDRLKVAEEDSKMLDEIQARHMTLVPIYGPLPPMGSDLPFTLKGWMINPIPDSFNADLRESLKAALSAMRKDGHEEEGTRG